MGRINGTQGGESPDVGGSRRNLARSRSFGRCSRGTREPGHVELSEERVQEAENSEGSTPRPLVEPTTGERVLVGQRSISEKSQMFQEGCFPDPTGMTAEHFRPLLDSARDAGLFVGVRVNRSARGYVPAEIMPVIRLGRITAFAETLQWNSRDCGRRSVSTAGCLHDRAYRSTQPLNEQRPTSSSALRRWGFGIRPHIEEIDVKGLSRHRGM